MTAMPLSIWILRHGEAVAHDSRSSDAERELTPRGERQSADAGAALAKLGIELAACYTSPRVRARDTARLACQSLNVEPEVVQALSAGFATEDLDEMLLAQEPGAHILIVGHEPDLSQLVHDLTGARVKLPKGGVAAIELEGREGRLVVLVRPRELEAMSAREAARLL